MIDGINYYPAKPKKGSKLKIWASLLLVGLFTYMLVSMLETGTKVEQTPSLIMVVKGDKEQDLDVTTKPIKTNQTLKLEYNATHISNPKALDEVMMNK